VQTTITAKPVSHDDEPIRVLQWRLKELIRAGFTPTDAVVLATRLDIDLHEAVALLVAGCPPETALRILL